MSRQHGSNGHNGRFRQQKGQKAGELTYLYVLVITPNASLRLCQARTPASSICLRSDWAEDPAWQNQQRLAVQLPTSHLKQAGSSAQCQTAVWACL